MDKVLMIDIYKLNPNKKNRKIDEAKVKEYAESIRIAGLLQYPIVQSNQDGSYTILAGHHRIRAYYMLAKEDSKYLQIPCRVLEMNELDADLVLIDSNLHKDLEPYELMLALGRKEEIFKAKIASGELGCGGAVRDIVAAYSPMLKSTQIGKYLRIYKRASPELKEAFQKGKITMEKAAELSKLKSAEQIIALNKGNIHLSEDLFLTNVENRMIQKLATRVTVKNKQICIHFTDTEDLNRLLEALGCLEEEL